MSQQPTDTPANLRTIHQLRVRYGETDQMGTYYYARALDWFEVARTELMRSLGFPYAEMERRGAMLPVIEAHVECVGRARYDDLLDVKAAIGMQGKVRVRFDVEIAHADGGPGVARGYTIHAVVDPDGRPIRPPEWLRDILEATTSQNE